MPGSRRTPWPSFGRARGRQGGEGRGRRRRRGLPRDEVERTDASTAVSGDENDGEWRKKRRGEEDEQGAIPRLTGRPHMQWWWLPNRLPHRPGERAAPTRWRPGRRGSSPRREGEKGGKAGHGGGTAAGPRARGELGRRPGWAERGGGEERGKEKIFPFYFSYFSSNSSLECMIHKPSQSNNKMHDSAWCIKQKKVLLGFTYTRSQTESRYNFGKDQGLARGKGKRKG
jgi:hypothetical protein